MTDKTNSLNEDKLHKLLFLKKNLLILKEIKKNWLSITRSQNEDCL